MTSRTIPAAILPLVALATLSCSKTQDTAPERRIFGDPPVIQSVDPNYYDATKFAQCDFGSIMDGFYCENGFFNVEYHEGGGWPDDGDPSNDSTVPGVFIEGNYGEIALKVRATDPNSLPPPAQSNILMVSASFPDPQDNPPKTETSIVLFDDGSSNKFKFPQKVTKVGEDCQVDVFGNCACFGARYDVTSGDDATADGLFTRKLAMVDKLSLNPQAAEFLQDCIMRVAGQTPILAEHGWVYNMKIEAVDRQGNLTAWPAKLPATIEPSSFRCNGDECACCFMQSNDFATDCRGKRGSTTSDIPDGICCTFFGGCS